MRQECNITVLETKYFPELQERYLADPRSGRARSSNRVIPSCSNARRGRMISIT